MFVVNLFSFATVLLTVNMFEITEIKYVFNMKYLILR